MITDLSALSDGLKVLWDEHLPDYDHWCLVAMDYLAAQAPKDQTPRLLSSRILYGVDGDFETHLADLLVVVKGVVFVRAAPLYHCYGGLLQRESQNQDQFGLYSITDPTATVEIIPLKGGRAKIQHSSGGRHGGVSAELILVNRWAELRGWLDRWLPTRGVEG